LLSNPPEGAIDRRRAHRQQLLADFGGQIDVTMPLHRVDQHWQQCFQALAANPVRGFPKQYKRISICFVIPSSARPPARRRRDRIPKHPHRVFPMKAGDGDELVQNARLFHAV
jgi:hypothetical protein